MESAFEAIKNRRATRDFSSRKIDPQLLYQIIELANTAPSSFNLQPWHFLVVRDESLRELLYHIALENRAVLSAPQTLVLVADPKAWKNSFPQTLKQSVDRGLLTSEQGTSIRRTVNLIFRLGPMGIFGFAKKIVGPLRRMTKPTPRLITSKEDAIAHTRAQTMLAAATFMIAAAGAGLATCPIESFDEERLKKLLAIPRKLIVPLIIPLGYAIEGEEPGPQIRFPLPEKLSINLYPNKLAKIKKK